MGSPDTNTGRTPELLALALINRVLAAQNSAFDWP